MDTKKLLFWKAFCSRADLREFGVDALLLFALELRFAFEDISTLATNSLTEGVDDKKADLVHIDAEAGYAVIAQTYISEDMDKKEAPSNKACDLNTAVSWLLSRPIAELPKSIRSHAEELRRCVQDESIRTVHIWYVHNLAESDNVRDELTTVELTARSAITSSFPTNDTVEIHALEVGVLTLEDWYKSILSPILVSDEFSIPISGGFEIAEADWTAYVTSIPAQWLYKQFKKHQTRLFSANVRDYLGSRRADRNINNGIRITADDDPCHFWVFNNGITALVHEFKEKRIGGKLEIHFSGLSIVNGAQTTGAIGNLEAPPESNAMVQVRFITCKNVATLQDIVRYNNSQNRITAPDFRSNDRFQRRLQNEFESIPSVEYFPRRGGHEELIRRKPNVLPSVTAGQALAAFHRDPDVAYHQKTEIWESDSLYSRYFNERTGAEHIVFAYSLLKAVEDMKLHLLRTSKAGDLTEIEERQLEFFRNRGSTFLMASAVARCLEIFLKTRVPDLFSLRFRENLSPQEAIEIWSPIVEIASSFTAPLAEGLSDGFKNAEAVNLAVKTFQSLIDSTKQANDSIYSNFRETVI